MSTNYTCSFTNERVWNFYNTHPEFNLESMNLLLLDLLEKLIPESSNGLTSTFAEQLVENMKQLQSQISGVSDTMTHLKNESLNTITLRFAEFKKEYLDDVKMVLNNNVSDKFAPLLREQNSIMLDKTHLLINDIIPKNNETLTKHMSDAIKSLHSSIVEDTNKFLSSSINPRTLQDFIASLENKLTQSEQRLENNIKDIKTTNDTIREISTSHQQTSVALNTNVTDMLKKMDNAASKGKISENLVFNILTKLYPSAQQIDYVAGQKETGDIILVRENKPTILIENKNWDKIVSKEEVKKFIHDIETQNCSGLFLSQNTGIANKTNFEIKIHDKNVLLFIHEVNYDAEKIKLGIEIIDHFKSTIDYFDCGSDIDTIEKELLDAINKEFQDCCSQKLNLLRTLKDFSDKMRKQVDDIRFPELEKYLSSRYTFSVGTMVCEFCNFIAKNQGSLSAHRRGCTVRKELQAQKTTDSPNVEVNNIVISTASPVVEQISIPVPKKPSKKSKSTTSDDSTNK
jgi:hypothetical protein